ncbi:biotin transport system ATP-binding protein [Kytococcus aerolatus]|uniref:Biotin transport system ATP-binding protein n=1 Tax=Kytococcus aerolatus TaxID=592308 RepID=A0A212TEZ0_9MICO|nr:ABC transporter ATP-binding protein [Kytococcus aerolatus]SNC64592.1 biotin transport system ATP-binding protein [Kytococcus aerolatus]
MSGAPGIRFEGVTLARQGRVALDGVDLQLTEHRVALIGANGSGKSTLARCVIGLERPTAGRVLVNGVDVRRHARRVRRDVGFLFSDPDHQIVMPTVREDLEFSARRRGWSAAQREEAVQTALARAGLEGHADHPCHLLSGGQKQLLALGAVLMAGPSILVADEPTTLLDLRNRRRVSAELMALEQQVVIVTHHLDLIEEVDRVVVLDEARVVCDDVPSVAIPFYERLMA